METMKMPVIKILLGFVAICSLSACDNNDFPGPDEVLTDYLMAVYTGKNEVAYEYVSSADKSVKGLKDYLAENKNRADPIVKVFVDDFEVRIDSLQQSESNAAVKVSIILPDTKGMLKGLGKAPGKSEGAKLDPNTAVPMLKKKYADQDVPTV